MLSSFCKTETYLHHAELGAGAGLTWDGLGDSGTAVDVCRYDLQEERLHGCHGCNSRSTMNGETDRHVERRNQFGWARA